MPTELVEVFTSLGTAGGVTAVLSWLLMRQLDRAQEERAAWLETLRAEQAETRKTLTDLQTAIVDLRIMLAERL